MATPSEDRLFEDFRRTGDPRALATLFDRTAKDLLRLGLHVSGDLADAEDLVQETFLTAIRSARGYRPEGRVRAWLCGILQNRARRLRKGRRRRTEAIVAEPPDPGAADGLATASAADLRVHVRAALDRLAEPYRTVLALRYRHEFSVQEIAVALERPPNTVQSQLQRGTERLRRLLPGEGALGSLAAFSTDGLAAIRESVLGAASTSAVAGAGVAWFGTKLRVAAATVALCAIGLGVPWALGAFAPAVAPRAVAPRPGGGAADVRVAERVEAPEPLERVRVPPLASPRSSQRDGQLVPVRVVERGSGRPVPGAIVTSFLAVSPVDALTADEWQAAMQLYASDLEAFQQRFGGTRTADESGVVLFDVADTWSYMTARAGHLYGERWDWDAREIVVAPDRELRVRVFDRAGQPVPGARVRLGVDPRRPSVSDPGESRTAAANEDGIARFPHVQALARDLRERLGQAELCLVPCAVGLWPEPAHVIPLGHDALPETLDVRVPASGSARVTVLDAHGRSVGSTDRFRLDVEVTLSGRDASTTLEPDADGMTRFRQLPVGRQLRFTARLDGCEASVEHPGLHHAGEVLDVEIRLGDGATTVFGRATDAEGEPLARAALRVRIGERSAPIRVDADGGGRFRILLADPESETIALTLERVQVRWRAGRWEDAVRPLGTSAEVVVSVSGDSPIIELGDVPFVPDPVLASGTFRVAPPRLLEKSRWLHPTIEERVGDAWTPVEAGAVVWHDDGTFTVRGRATTTALRMRGPSVYRGSSTGPLQLPPLEFARGADDLHVDVVGGSELAVDFLGPPALLRFDLHPAPGVWPAHDDRSLTGMTPDTHVLLGIVDPDLTAPLVGPLWPGRYRVVVRVPGIDEPVLELDDVELPPGERVRPLAGRPLDPNDRYDLVEARITDPDGDDLAATVWIRELATGKVDEVRVTRGRLERYVRRGGWEAVATSRRRGLTAFGATIEGAVVVPRSWDVPIRLRWADGGEEPVVAPSGTMLRVELEPAPGDPLASWVGVPGPGEHLARRAADAEHRFTCRAAGRYVVRLVATRDGRDTVVHTTERDLAPDVQELAILLPRTAVR